MKSTITYNKWDIILVPFPFTDLSTTKRRPGFIISPNEYNAGPDVIIGFITSRINNEKRIGDLLVEQWQEAGLPKPSLIRMKFATIDKSIIIKQIGKLQNKDQHSFNNNLKQFFEMK